MMNRRERVAERCRDIQREIDSEIRHRDNCEKRLHEVTSTAAELRAELRRLRPEMDRLVAENERLQARVEWLRGAVPASARYPNARNDEEEREHE